jgi:hypothetical protein
VRLALDQPEPAGELAAIGVGARELSGEHDRAEWVAQLVAEHREELVALLDRGPRLVLAPATALRGAARGEQGVSLPSSTARTCDASDASALTIAISGWPKQVRAPADEREGSEL